MLSCCLLTTLVGRGEHRKPRVRNSGGYIGPFLQLPALWHTSPVTIASFLQRLSFERAGRSGKELDHGHECFDGGPTDTAEVSTQETAFPNDGPRRSSQILALGTSHQIPGLSLEIEYFLQIPVSIRSHSEDRHPLVPKNCRTRSILTMSMSCAMLQGP